MLKDEISNILELLKFVEELGDDITKLTSVVFDHYNKLEYEITDLQFQLAALRHRIISLSEENKQC